MNDSDIKNEIISYLDEHYSVRTTVLIDAIKRDHTSDENLIERGYNVKSLYGKIRKLKEEGIILEIESDQFPLYGIKDPDKRAIYLVLKIVDERRKFIDGILPFLKSKNEGNIISALEEINRYRGKYHLNSSQLTQVIFALRSANITIINKALWILFYYIHNQKIMPSDTDLLIKNTKDVLFRFCRGDVINGNIHQYCLNILGMMKDRAVVDQLIYDAKNLERLQKVAGLYRDEFTAESIEMQRKILFEFERKLRNTKPIAENTQIADIISDIRTQATITVISPQKENGVFA
jgi:hypothetical protein